MLIPVIAVSQDLQNILWSTIKQGQPKLIAGVTELGSKLTI